MSWKCQKCDKKFKTEKELISHQNNKDLCPECCAILEVETSFFGAECLSCGWNEEENQNVEAII